MHKVVITLTTVPERLHYESDNGFKSVIKSLISQNYNNYEVHLNIPTVYNITNTEYVIPDWLSDMLRTYTNLKIFRTQDFGPPTKIIPTILREEKDTLLLVVDDDLIYHPDMCLEHVKYHKLIKNSAILYDGRSLVVPKYNDLRDSWVISVNEVSRVKELQHYKSASYFVKYFDDDFFENFLGKTLSDDILITYYFKYKKIPMYVVPYDSDIPHTQTYNDWYSYQGVTTFPVLRHADCLINTGCNHPEALKKEPKFFLPEEFKLLDNYL